uniref:Uncharacterized protein n=1 Tax=CrAss-like virus sp. ctXt06 TaxID=2825837 RepID=A0A8S5V6T6_9CAUD|nr:MAG TPA: hypothetical protein [CrAss-like virus sp. ctXt06]
MTKKCNRLRGERPKAFWGALVGGAMNLIGSAISSKSQARAIRRQIEAQKEAARTQLELANNSNLASTLNSYATATRSYNDEDDYNLKYRLGGNKRLGSNRIYITDGGNATKIGNDTYLLRGGSHEQTNETGQTGIGINVGGNEIEAEGGEVAQKKNGALRIFSAQPMLGGISPAQAVMSGANKDKVFSAQQRFKSRHHLSDGGGKAKHGTEVPYKRIHINEDGTFTDTLTGKNYNTSATNGEDVVITAKANHWKEAGKKNTSSYFDPMGAVNFATAAGAPILNANPSNIIGSIRDSKSASDFLKHYMMQDTGGFVNTKWAKEHPYLSLGINTIGDIGLGIGANKAVDILRNPMNYGKYGYKINKLYKKAGLLDRGDYKTIQENYEKNYIYDSGQLPYDYLAHHYNESYPIAIRNKILDKDKHYFDDWVYKNREEKNRFKEIYRKRATDNTFTEMTAPIHYGFKKGDDIKTYEDLMNHNPEYYEFLKETNLPWNEQSTIDTFLKRQKTSLRGVYADDKETAKKYLTEIQAKRKGGDRLDTNGGLYSSNSTGIANAFKNPNNGLSNGYIGKLHYDFGINRDKPIADQLRQARMKIVRGGKNNVFAGTKYYPKSIKEARKQGAVAIEDNYGRSNGDVLNVTERAYLPGSAKQNKLTLQNLEEYLAQENQRGRWNTSGVDKMKGDEELFIPKKYNRYDDFINAARIFLKPEYKYNYNKERKFISSLTDKMRTRSIYRNKLIDMSRRDNKGSYKKFNVDKILSFDEDLPFRFGGRIKLRNGGLTSKDRGSSKHPYPSVSSKDFAGGGRSYPIPTKADAVDALRLAGLHGRSDVRSKVFSKYPSLRKKSSLGSYTPPVKGMRTKFAIGGKEDKGYDMTGELSPVISTAKWRTPRFATLGSVDTTARAIPNFDTIKIPTYTPLSTIPYKGQNVNRSRTIFSGGDYLGLGIDTLSALGTGLITSNAYKNLDFNYNLPNFVEESPVALNTTYHNEAQKSNVERNRLNSRNSILRNTMSGSTAVGRMQGVDTNALYQLNQLADTKENKETELMNQNLLNEQQVRARNAAARNQYYNTVATIKNAALEAKNNASLARSQAFSTSLSGLSQAWNNFWTAGRTAYEDDQARRAMIASSKDATPTKLIEMGYDLSPQIIAALYSTSTDQNTKDFYLSMLDEKQRRKYGIS